MDIRKIPLEGFGEKDLRGTVLWKMKVLLKTNSSVFDFKKSIPKGLVSSIEDEKRRTSMQDNEAIL